MAKIHFPLNTAWLLVLAGALLVGYYPTWRALFTLWSNTQLAYSHGLLTSILALMAFYGARHVFRAQTMSAHWFSLLACLGASSVWFISQFLSIQIATQLILLPLIYFAIASLYGLKSALACSTALAYLLFSIPVWDYLNTPLQDMTTHVASAFMELSGLTAYIEGNFITIPYGTFEIAGGCSGLRYFLVSLVLVTYYIGQGNNALLSRLLMFSLAIAFALLANWVRVILIILIGYESEMQSDIVHDHELFGWFIYMLACIPCFCLLNRLEKRSTATQSAQIKPDMDAQQGVRFMPLLLLVLALSAGPLASLSLSQLTSGERYQLSPHAPMAGWNLDAHHDATWQLNFKGSINMPPLTFAKHTGGKIHIRGIYYHKEQQGAELVNHLNQVAKGKHWTLSPPPKGLAKPKQRSVKSRLITSRGLQRRLVYSYYRIGETTSQSGFDTKVAQLKTALRPTIFKGFIAYGIDCRSDCRAEAKQLSAFIDAYESSGSVHRANETSSHRLSDTGVGIATSSTRNLP